MNKAYKVQIARMMVSVAELNIQEALEFCVWAFRTLGSWDGLGRFAFDTYESEAMNEVSFDLERMLASALLARASLVHIYVAGQMEDTFIGGELVMLEYRACVSRLSRLLDGLIPRVSDGLGRFEFGEDAETLQGTCGECGLNMSSAMHGDSRALQQVVENISDALIACQSALRSFYDVWPMRLPPVPTITLSKDVAHPSEDERSAFVDAWIMHLLCCGVSTTKWNLRAMLDNTIDLMRQQVAAHPRRSAEIKVVNLHGADNVPSLVRRLI